MYFDSHCHLTDSRFTSDLDEVLSRAREAGVGGMVTIASDVEDAEAALRLAAKHEDLWCTAGIHPHVAAEADADGMGRLRRLVEGADSEAAAPAARDPSLVAVGETGLDYHYDNSPRDVQRRLLDDHASLAIEVDLPLVVHSRDAEDDTRSFLRGVEGQVRGVLHCFTSGPELLEAGLEAGWHVSYSGIASFGSFDGADGVRLVPGDRLLVETDAPYLAPIPFRGKRNEPSFVPHVAKAIGRIRDEDPVDVGRYTALNARRFYRIDA